MTIKKRRKSSRFRGSRTHARGFKKKARGSGHRGGFGMSGTGKRGDQKKSMIINLFGNDYFGKDRALRKPVFIKTSVLNVGDIELNLPSLIKQGIAKESKGAYEIDLGKIKILAGGEVKSKLNIKALSASESAIEKVKKAGGNLSVSRKVVEKLAAVKTEKKETTVETEPIVKEKVEKKEEKKEIVKKEKVAEKK